MRFFKIFLICFFSLIGVIGAVLGIMYLAGSFNKVVVEPTEIHFEQKDFYVDSDFTLTINSSTEGVTEKNVTLSLRDQDGDAVDGFITDGVIKIPQNVEIGKPFNVTLITAPNEELDNIKWIVGGVSEIFASSESDKAIDISCSVHVDVPIHSISVVTYTNDNQQNPQNSFALGESFYAEAIFKPSTSKFKYSSQTIKKVFFDISFNNRGYIAENQDIIDEMNNLGYYNISGYTVLKTTNESVPKISIKARTFLTANIEDYYLSLGLTEDDLIKYLQNSSYGCSSDADLIFTNRTVAGFDISNINTKFTLPVNQISQIFANTLTEGLPNLKINITASDKTSLQGKINDVGLRLLVNDAGVYREATKNEIFFDDNTNFDFGVNQSGEGLYYFDGDNFIEISSVINERYRKSGEVFVESPTGSYYKLDDSYILISETYGETYDKYYFPNIVASNVDNSFWNIVSVAENLPFFFEVRLFEKDDVIQTPNTILYSYNTLTSFVTGNIVNSSISWIDETAVNLTYIDSNIDDQKIYPEFNLAENLQFSNVNSTYSFVKFYAYSTNENVNVNSILQNIQPASKIDLTRFNITAPLFEINGNILRALGAGSVNVIAVVLKTDYLGRLIENNGFYEVYAISTPKGNSVASYQPLEFNIDKTIQDISASINVKTAGNVMNISQNTLTPVNKLSFMQNQDILPIFNLSITLTADATTDILKEVNLFVDAWNNGRINLQALTLSGLESDLLLFNQDASITAESGNFVANTWTFDIDVFSLETNIDTDLKILLSYQQTETQKLEIYVQDVVLPVEIADKYQETNIGYAIIEIYDAKAYTVEFGVETTEDNPVVKSFMLQAGTQISPDSFVASSVETVYMQNGLDVSDLVLYANGEYILIFHDKFGNVIDVPSSDFSITSQKTSSLKNNQIVSMIEYSSMLSEVDKPTAILYLQESSIGLLTQVKFNRGNINNGYFENLFVDITDDYLENNNKIVQITRYGAKNANIDLLGENGLLDILYQAVNLDNDNTQNNITYQLYDIISFNFETTNWQSTYQDCLRLSDDGRTIEILKTIGTAIKLNIKANTGLGYVVQIELNILPNIDTTYSVITEQEGASDYVQNNTYHGIYSDNNVQVQISFTMKLRESFSVGYFCNTAQSNFFFADGDNRFFVNNELESQAILTVAFLADELGMQTITITSGEGAGSAYDFKREIYLYVNPNLELNNATDKTVNKSITISALDVAYNIITATDYKRIVGNKEITSSFIQVSIAETLDNDISTQQVYLINPDGSKTLTSNIFSTNGFTISANERLLGEYFVIVDVTYGGSVIGQVFLTVSPNISINTESEDYKTMFTNFDGKLHLTLVSNKTYDIDLLKNLFLNVDFASFNPSNLQNVYTTSNIAGSTITVSGLNSFTTGNYLLLSNSVGIITFPVLFVPVEIGSVQYDVVNAVNPEATIISNNDFGYLQNHNNYLIENDIYDIYDSGKTSSLISQNYTLSYTDNIYTFKNLLPQNVFLLAFVDGQYYYYQVNGINVANTTFKFALQEEDVAVSEGSVSVVARDGDGWVVIDEQIIDANYKVAQNDFIGVFSSVDIISSITELQENRGSGLALEFLNNSSHYNFVVVDEIGDNFDFDSLNNLNVSQYATYNANLGLLTANSSTSNQIVWLLIKKADSIVSAYRIFIIANSALNIYYPYYNEPINSNSSLTGDEGEYVYFTNNQDIVINFNDNIPSNMPSSSLGQNVKRIMLQYGNELIGFTNADNYSLAMQIQSININGVTTQDPNAFNAYCSFAPDTNTLTIKNTRDIIVIYMYAEAILKNSQNVNQFATGNGVVYKIFVNYNAINYELVLENDLGQLTDQRLSSQKQTINYGDVYDFSKVVLVNNTGSTLNRVEGLKYYIYDVSGRNLNEYFELNPISKTLSILPDVEIVSDLEINMVYYTMFGELCEVPLVFKSNLNLNFNDNQSTVLFDEEQNVYIAFTDIAFDLSNIFSLNNGLTPMNVPSQYWYYSINGGESYLNADNLLFTQDQASEYNVLVKVALSEFAPETYLDDYIFAVDFNIKNSIISNFDAPKYMTVGVDGIFEYPTDDNGQLSISNILFEESDVESNDYLFSIKSLDILDDYQIKLNVLRGSEYVSIAESEVDLQNNGVALTLNSPAESVEILIEIRLTKNDFSITSRFSFMLSPDAYITPQYPTANENHSIDYEAIYLNGAYINKHSDNSQIGSGGSEQIKLTGLGFFDTARLKLTNAHNTSINFTPAIIARTNVTVASQTDNIVVRVSNNGQSYLNEDIDFDAGATVDTIFMIQWVGGNEISTNITAGLSLNIYIDGIHRATYNITFYSQISNIFDISITPHNDVKSYENIDDEFEIFYVENGATGNIFANSDALIQFKLRENYTLNLGSKTDVWNFYINSVSENNKVGSVNIRSSDSIISLALSGREAISLDNLLVTINDDANAYVFKTTVPNSIYLQFVDAETNAQLSYRANTSFMGETLSYEKFSQYILFDTQNASKFVINKNSKEAINAPAYVSVNVKGVEFAKYAYTLLYDFYADPNFNSDNHAIIMNAGDEISSGLQEFEITRLNGNDFSQNYFADNDVTIEARVIMITDSQYPTTKSIDNINYINNQYIEYYNPNYVNLGSEFYNYVDFLSIGYKQIENIQRTYDFTIRADGAENNGNYVYILISFSADGVEGSMAYTVVKVLINPVWNVQLYNDISFTSVNSADNPLEIRYDSTNSNLITRIFLASKDSSANFINIYSGSNNSTNYATQGNFALTIKDEIANYVELDKSYNQGSSYFKDYIILQNTSNTAKYGDKYGYIEIKDKYGYVCYFYLHLIAQQEDALSYASAIIGTSNSDVYEGSTIGIVDNSYTANGTEKADYLFKINNLDNLLDLGLNYKVTYSIADVNVESYNTNPGQDNYNTGKISVQPASFYATSTLKKQPVVLKITLDVSGTLNGNTYFETIIIDAGMNLVQRYTVSSGQTSYVREGQSFNVSDYIYVRDETVDGNVGKIDLSNTAFTLVVPSVLNGASISVEATSGTGSSSVSVATAVINVGKTASGDVKQATYNNYYYPINEFTGFKNLAFSNYTFTIKSIILPNNSGFVLCPLTSYTINGGEQSSSSSYIFYNSFSNQTVSVVYYANGVYYYKTYGQSSRAIEINTQTIINGWNRDTEHSFPAQSSSGFVGIYNEDRTRLISSINSANVYNNSSIKLIQDKLLSVVTLNVDNSSTINVSLNNQTYKVDIPFNLNIDGTQSTSVYEAILKIANGNISDPRLNNLSLYEKDKNVVTADDMQKLKGITIYNDTLTLSIAGGYSGRDVDVRVHFDDENGQASIKSKTYRITNNNPHYYYISLYSILGEKYGLQVDVSYKIEVIYTLTNIEAGTEYDYQNVISPVLNGTTSSVEATYDAVNNNCTYVHTIDDFSISQMPIENNVYSDKIDILSASEFSNKVKANIQKFYLVKYTKDNVVYYVDVNYNVTPKYYQIDASGVLQDGNSYNIIYFNQCTPVGENQYQIPFENWAGNYILDDYYGNDITLLTEAENDLYFEIQTTDENQTTTATGAAFLNPDNSLQTTSSFDPEQHYIKVSVYTYVHGQVDQKVYIGDIFIKMDLTSVSVPVPGTYNIKINSPNLGGLCYTINTPYEFTSRVAKIDDILKDNPNMEELVKENEETQELQLGFYTGSYYTYEDANDCNFSVVTVFSGIYNASFQNGFLNIKINLNETQGSIGQRITLQALALPTSSINTSKTSTDFYLTVGYNNGVYYLNYSNSINGVDNTIAQIFKGDDGFYNVQIELNDIFSEIFVGTDYNYKITIKSIESVDVSSSLSVVYAENTESALIDQTMFFQISYISENSNLQSKVIGIKNTVENQKLAGPLGYAIDLRNLLGGINLQNCTVAFLGSYSLNCDDGGQYQLLLGYNVSTDVRVYSIAVIDKYDIVNPFFVEDYALSMINFSIGFDTSVEFYNYPTQNYTVGSGSDIQEILMPTYIDVNQTASSSDNYYFAFQDIVSNIDLVGVKTSGSKVVVKVVLPDSQLSQRDIRIKDCSKYIDTDISQQFSSQTSISTQWQATIGVTEVYTETEINKESISVDGQSFQQFQFDVAPISWGISFGNAHLVSDSINLSNIAGVTSPDSSIFFQIVNKDSFNRDNFLQSIAIGIDEVSSIKINEITNQISSFSSEHKIAFIKQNVFGKLDVEGTYKFEIKNMSNVVTGINALNYYSLQNTNYFISQINILPNYGQATLITDDIYNFSLIDNSFVTYYTLTDENNNQNYYVSYLSLGNKVSIPIDIGALQENQKIDILSTTIALNILYPDKPLIMFVSSKNYDQIFNLTSSSETKQITIPANTNQIEINLKDLFGNVSSLRIVVTPYTV